MGFPEEFFFATLRRVSQAGRWQDPADEGPVEQSNISPCQYIMKGGHATFFSQAMKKTSSRMEHMGSASDTAFGASIQQMIRLFVVIERYASCAIYQHVSYR